MIWRNDTTISLSKAGSSAFDSTPNFDSTSCWEHSSTRRQIPSSRFDLSGCMQTGASWKLLFRQPTN